MKNNDLGKLMEQIYYGGYMTEDEGVILGANHY
jgi:hypothetical protein